MKSNKRNQTIWVSGYDHNLDGCAWTFTCSVCDTSCDLVQNISQIGRQMTQPPGWQFFSGEWTCPKHASLEYLRVRALQKRAALRVEYGA